jgi:trimethylamine:corrinoid methyltransferase-like protein
MERYLADLAAAGGHRTGAAHTMGRVETAFHRPRVSDV